MTDYRSLYVVLGNAVDEFFEYLKKEDSIRAVEVLMRARIYCLEKEIEGKTED